MGTARLREKITVNRSIRGSNDYITKGQVDALVYAQHQHFTAKIEEQDRSISERMGNLATLFNTTVEFSKAQRVRLDALEREYQTFVIAVEGRTLRGRLRRFIAWVRRPNPTW